MKRAATPIITPDIADALKKKKSDIALARAQEWFKKNKSQEVATKQPKEKPKPEEEEEPQRRKGEKLSDWLKRIKVYKDRIKD